MAREIEIQAHRGALGHHVESTLEAFGHALAVGVTSLEFDTMLTRDGSVVLTHDRRVNPAVSRDTAPACPGDPAFPYVGTLVRHLDLAQIRTLDCGSLAHPRHPGQRTHPGARMVTLTDLATLLRERRADEVRLAVEVKVEAAAPEETEPRERVVEAVVSEVRSLGLTDRVTAMSFDWETVRAVRELAPELPLAALTDGFHPVDGRVPPSVWTGGIDVEDFGGDEIAAVASLPGVTTYGPVAVLPQELPVSDPACRPYVTAELCDRAHAAGLRLVPWTVDDPGTMHHLLDAGVDGLCTNHPDRLRTVLAERGLPLPRQYP